MYIILPISAACSDFELLCTVEKRGERSNLDALDCNYSILGLIIHMDNNKERFCVCEQVYVLKSIKLLHGECTTLLL